MLEWPGKCAICSQKIDDWAEAGFFDRSWIHKSCYTEKTRRAALQGTEMPPLRSPLDRSRVLEWPMLISILLFHFGIGIGFIGWIMLTQDTQTSTDTIGAALLAIGLAMPVTGIFGVAMNIRGRRRIEHVRRALDLSGGWKPAP